MASRPRRAGLRRRAAPAAFEPALAAARKAYDDPYAARCDATDPYVALCYRHVSPADAYPDALDRWARTLWAPLMASLEP